MSQHKVHEHKYTKQATGTVPIYNSNNLTGRLEIGTQRGKDKIKYHICVEVVSGKVCGHKIAYDLERIKT